MPTPKRTPPPLGVRVPNPPAIFVGRKAEVAALHAALSRGPVAVVTGEGGAGKSALALHYLKERRLASVAEAIFVSLRGGDAREPVALGVARALVRASGLHAIDWPALLGAPDALAGFALDLAEDREAWVVLDDLHHGDAAEILAFLRQVARYARKSRWIATTRAPPAADELAGQMVPLGAMKPADLLALARVLDPAAQPAALRRAVAAARGSPWRMRRLHGGGPEPGRHADVLGDLAGETLAFLSALSLLSAPVPEATLGRIAPRPAEDLDALSLRGLVEQTAEGVRLHDVVREQLPRVPDTPHWRAWRAAAGAALAEAGEAGLRVQATALLLDAARPDEATALLDTAGEALLEGGYALALWRMLEAHAAAEPAPPRLDHWRLRTAVDLADAEVLARARPPRDDAGPATRLLWAKLLHAGGRTTEAGTLAGAVHGEARAAGDVGLAFAAGMLWAQAIGNGGDPRDATLLLASLEAPDPHAGADRDSLLSMGLAISGESDDALARARAVQRRLPELPPHLRKRAGRRVARVYSVLGRLREAREVLDALFADGAGTWMRLEAGRDLLYARAALAIDSGDLAGGLEALERLEPYVGRASMLHPYLVNMRAHLLFGAGDLDGVDACLVELSGEGTAAQLREEAEALAIRVATLRRAARDPGADGGRSASLYASLRRISAAEHAARRGLPARAEAALLDVPLQNRELGVAAAAARAAAQLAGGDAEEALATALAAAAEGEASCFAVREAEARQLACEIAVALGRGATAARAAADLSRVAAAMPSLRFQRAARLYEMLAAGPPDVAVLEELAGDAGAAPDVAYHARALLGGEAPGDAVDGAVREAVRRGGFTPPRPITAPARALAWQPGWGIDDARRQVWLPDGRRVDLARHPVPWRLLDRLADHGGAATKEELVTEVWEEREYHPLRHDNRLQAAVRKLRVEIEDDPSRPERVLTTSEGYALGGAVRRA